jgi:pyruvate dehydrogenase E2 component (dihydrolipoamide acetyltransferase)
MAQIIGLPKLSPTMEEGVLVRWTKKEGDKVSPGDLVAEVETDKANMDFNMEDEGVLLKLLVKEGDTVKLGAPVAILGNAGEDVSALIEQAKATGGAAPAAAVEAKPAAQPAKPAAQGAKPAAQGAKPAPAKPAPAKPVQPAKSAGSNGAADNLGAEDSANAPAAKKPPREATRPEQDQSGKAAVKPAAKSAPAKPAQAAPAPSNGGRLLASPLAKTLAIELGIDLREVTGTGPGGRIVERDVRAAADGAAAEDGQARAPEHDEAPADDEAVPDEAAAEAAPASSQALAVRAPARARAVPDADTEGDWEDIPASNMRKRIASRLTEAKRDVPHIYLMRDLDAAALLAYRQRLNDLLGDKGKVSVNDLVVKATAIALRRMPECNASWAGDAIRQFHRVHIGVAVAIPDGLVTPVVRDADRKGIGSIAAEIKDLAERAKKRGLKAHEITGSTFSVSNLGMFGIERFTAIINPPEAGIVAVGVVRDVAVVDKGGVVAGKRMIEKPESLAL